MQSKPATLGGRRAFGALALLAALALGLSACESYKPKEYTSDDDCQDCPPGIFSGEDGSVTWEL